VKSFHPLSSAILDPEEESSNMPRPDFTQMIPFKPKAQAIPGDHPVPGMFANTDKVKPLSIVPMCIIFTKYHSLSLAPVHCLCK
jgi:hypothetical protein